MNDSWLRSKKKQLDVQHHRERFKTGIMMSVWNLTVEKISINKLKRTQVCQSTTNCSKTMHLDEEFKCTGRLHNAVTLKLCTVMDTQSMGSTVGLSGPRIHLMTIAMPREPWLFSPMYFLYKLVTTVTTLKEKGRYQCCL